MKILFVSSGNGGSISPIVKNQADSLKEFGTNLEIVYFLVKGKGIFGYLSNLLLLRQKIKVEKPDIIHAHYSYCGILSTLCFTRRSIITSLMGSDVMTTSRTKYVIKAFSYFSWKHTVVKTEKMRTTLGISNAIVIPNGVNFSKFYPIPKALARLKLGFNPEAKIILFASNPSRYEKNWALAKEAIENLGINVEVKFLVNIPNEDAKFYYNSADVVVLSSLWEGSPNVIKEAAACNRPIVATDVGDIKQNIGSIEGCYICKHNSEDLRLAILKAMQ